MANYEDAKFNGLLCNGKIGYEHRINIKVVCIVRIEADTGIL